MKRWSLELPPHIQGLEIARINEDGSYDLLIDATFQRVAQGVVKPATYPFVQGHDLRPFLQEAMDLGYRMGLRPSKGEDVAAVQRHLQDMRAIAFHTLKMPSQS